MRNTGKLLRKSRLYPILMFSTAVPALESDAPCSNVTNNYNLFHNSLEGSALETMLLTALCGRTVCVVFHMGQIIT